MENVRQMEITGVLQALKEKATRYLELTEVEQVSYMLIQSKMNELNILIERAKEELRLINQQIAESKETAKKVIDTAKEEALRVQGIINKRNVDSMLLADEAKAFYKDCDLARYSTLKSKAKALSA